jgi:hypothetical protein
LGTADGYAQAVSGEDGGFGPVQIVRDGVDASEAQAVIFGVGVSGVSLDFILAPDFVLLKAVFAFSTALYDLGTNAHPRLIGRIGWGVFDDADDFVTGVEEGVVCRYIAFKPVEFAATQGRGFDFDDDVAIVGSGSCSFSNVYFAIALKFEDSHPKVSLVIVHACLVYSSRSQ